MPTVLAGRLVEIVGAILAAAGASTESAGLVAHSLVDANLTGHDSHGVMRLPSYVRDIRQGRLHPAATPSITAERATSALVDGARTFGQVGARFATDLAIRKAREAGLAWVAAAHCHHTGRLGEWAERAAAAGLVGMVMGAEARGPYAVVPHGGSRAALGTNPIAWAVPRPGASSPILLDYATSVAAIGKLQLARARGEDVPAGWILTGSGEPTTHVEDFFAGGMLLPFFGHKGYALSVIVELLAVGLSGGDRAPADQRSSCLTVLALDPTIFRPAEEFAAVVEALVERLKAVAPGPGQSEVLLPGEPEVRARAERSRAGVPLPDATWEAIRITADEFGVPISW